MYCVCSTLVKLIVNQVCSKNRKNKIEFLNNLLYFFLILFGFMFLVPNLNFNGSKFPFFSSSLLVPSVH